MSKYRRNYTGSVYFFTLVTSRRKPFLTSPAARAILNKSFRAVQQELPFEITAIVLLPDHLHTIWTLPRNDVDYSERWRKIKSTFTKAWRRNHGGVTPQTESHLKRGEHAVWQRRFFEHTCRDDRDSNRCLEYLQISPLKHGLVTPVGDRPWPSSHRLVAAG